MTGLVVILRDVIALAALLAVIGLVYGVLGWLFAQPLVLLVLAIALVGGRCWFCFRRAYPVGSIDGRLTPPSLPGPRSTPGQPTVQVYVTVEAAPSQADAMVRASVQPRLPFCDQCGNPLKCGVCPICGGDRPSSC